MNIYYSMPASHPGVTAAVEQLKAWGAPEHSEQLDYEDAYFYPNHVVRFFSQTMMYESSAGMLYKYPEQSYRDMLSLHMIDTTKPGPDKPVYTAPPPVTQVILDAVIGAPDSTRPGLYEPAPGSNPIAGAKHKTEDGRNWRAIQIQFGFGGAQDNIRWVVAYEV